MSQRALSSPSFVTCHPSSFPCPVFGRSTSVQAVQHATNTGLTVVFFWCDSVVSANESRCSEESKTRSDVLRPFPALFSISVTLQRNQHSSERSGSPEPSRVRPLRPPAAGPAGALSMKAHCQSVGRGGCREPDARAAETFLWSAWIFHQSPHPPRHTHVPQQAKAGGERSVK